MRWLRRSIRGHGASDRHSNEGYVVSQADLAQPFLVRVIHQPVHRIGYSRCKWCPLLIFRVNAVVP